MKVIIIDEENHGFIGVADSVIHAIDFLIDTHWLTGDSYLYQYAGNGKWTESSVKKRFGVGWAQTLKQFNREEFNDVFEGSFYFSEETVYTGEE